MDRVTQGERGYSHDGYSSDAPGFPPYDDGDPYDPDPYGDGAAEGDLGDFGDVGEFGDVGDYAADYGDDAGYADPGESGARRRESLRSLEHRYEPRARRTTAEPLSASWRPTAPTRPKSKKGRTPGSGPRALIKMFGWRLYAVPVLLAVTVFVAVQTVREPGPGGGGEPNRPVAAASEASEAPKVKENPAEPVKLDIPTARLPEGGSFTKQGDGTFHIVPGDGEQVGEGELHTYTVEVEDGLDTASFTGDDSFATAVEGTLSDPRSWTGTGDIALRRVDGDDAAPDFRVTLTSSGTAHQPELCGRSIPFDSSCHRVVPNGEQRVIINLARWVRGALAFSADLTGYRQYVINHEVGHALDLGHKGCEVDGGLAPVMMQQTFGVANDYVAKLNDLPGGDQGSVPADGKVCKPNAWPNPQPDGE